MSRIFKVQINLDDMCSQLDILDTDQEKLAWLSGFRVGSRGATLGTDSQPAKVMGRDFGFACYESAAAFCVSQSNKGKMSAESRKFNRGSTVVQPNVNRGSTEPQPNLNLSNIQVSNIDISNTQQPITIERVAKAPRAQFVPPSVDEVSDYCQERGNSVDPDQFVSYYESTGWMLGKKKIVSWKACVRTWEANDKKRQAESRPKEKLPSPARVAWAKGLTDIEPNDDWYVK